MSVGEHESEPVRGLPDQLPSGETLVWQGEPDWGVMARSVFHVRTVAIYFAVLIALHLATQLYGGGSISQVLLGSTWQLGLGLAAIGILAALARAYSATTVYTLTDKRLVLRFGVALPMMVNIPLEVITSADLRAHGDGSGDILLTLDAKKTRLSYMMMWPNVRPWHFSKVQPSLRGLRNVQTAVEALASVVDSGPMRAQSADTRATVENGAMAGMA